MCAVIALISYSLISCLKNNDDEVFKSIITKKVNFTIKDHYYFPDSAYFLNIFNVDGFYYLKIPDGGVYKKLYNATFEILGPICDNEINIYRISVVNSYINNSQKGIDSNFILTKIISLFGNYKSVNKSLDIYDYKEKKIKNVEFELPVWELRDREIYFLGNNVSKASQDILINCTVIIKLK
jgi:hypothetical protein